LTQVPCARRVSASAMRASIGRDGGEKQDSAGDE
jgi:hypothetical protein